jgi:hypothetical protein
MAKDAIFNNIINKEGDVQLPRDPLQDELDVADILSDYIQSGAFAEVELDSNIDPRLQIPSINQRTTLTPFEKEVQAHNAKVAATMVLRNDSLRSNPFYRTRLLPLKFPELHGQQLIICALNAGSSSTSTRIGINFNLAMVF